MNFYIKFVKIYIVLNNAYAMSDIIELQKIAKNFIDDRDWRKFHTIKDLAMNCSIESNELMEILLWRDAKFEDNILTGKDKKSLEMIENEVSDILFSCFAIADHLNFNIEDAYRNKMSELAKRYDPEKVKGKLVKIPSPEKQE
jgi:NTP pyrophosphatase (non-canonical NTP hydrolase)